MQGAREDHNELKTDHNKRNTDKDCKSRMSEWKERQQNIGITSIRNNNVFEGRQDGELANKRHPLSYTTRIITDAC